MANLPREWRGQCPRSFSPADGYIAKDLSADGTHLIFGSTSRFAPGGTQRQR